MACRAADLAGDRAILWARADRPARMMVEWATTESFADARTLRGARGPRRRRLRRQARPRRPAARPEDPLPRDAWSTSPTASSSASRSPAASGPRPRSRQNIRFVWSADTAGQGWGINPAWGGMKIYEAMRQVEPAFFIHSGRHDLRRRPARGRGAVARRQRLAERHDPGQVQGRRDARRVPRQLRLQPDGRARPALQRRGADASRSGTTTRSPTTGTRARTSPAIRPRPPTRSRASTCSPPGPPRRSSTTCRSGAIRSSRSASMPPSAMAHRSTCSGSTCAAIAGPTPRTISPQPGPDTAFLGGEQIRWLKQALLASEATWKVIASDMPIGLIVPDGETRFENGANGDGPARGRELEIAGLLRFIRDNEIRNVVWLTADVHYTAAHHYDPSSGPVPGVRAVLGVRLGALERRQLRPGQARQHLRARRWSSRSTRPRARSICRRPPACSSSARSTSTARARS